MAGNWKKTLDDLLYNGDLDGAYNLLDGILRDNSGDIKARIAFGKVQYELGDPDNARITFETVLKQSLAHLYPRFLLIKTVLQVLLDYLGLVVYLRKLYMLPLVCSCINFFHEFFSMFVCCFSNHSDYVSSLCC